MLFPSSTTSCIMVPSPNACIVLITVLTGRVMFTYNNSWTLPVGEPHGLTGARSSTTSLTNC